MFNNSIQPGRVRLRYLTFIDETWKLVTHESEGRSSFLVFQITLRIWKLLEGDEECHDRLLVLILKVNFLTIQYPNAANARSNLIKTGIQEFEGPFYPIISTEVEGEMVEFWEQACAIAFIA